MILADITGQGQDDQGARPLRPQRLRLHAEPRDGRAAGRREVRSDGELGDRMSTWRPAGRRSSTQYTHRRQRRGRNTKASARRRSAPRTSSRRRSRRRPACSTCRPTTSAWTTSRSRCPTPPASPMSAPRCRCIRRRAADNLGNFIAWDAGTGKIVWSDPGAVLGLVGRARHRRRRRLLRHARGLPEGGRRQDRQGALPLQDPVRHHRQRHHLRAQRQAVCRRAVRRRRLGRHRPGGRPAHPGEAAVPGMVRSTRAVPGRASVRSHTAGLGAVGGYAVASQLHAPRRQLTVFTLAN